MNSSTGRMQRTPCLKACAAVVLLLAAGCSGNDGPSPPTYTPVSVGADGNLYTLWMGDVRMVVDASLGARISEFSFRGTNVLSGPEVNIVSHGSTYWPSPQSSWCPDGVDCWPPPAPLDNEPWTGDADLATATVTLTSGKASLFGIPGSEVTVTKRLTLIPESGAIKVVYALNNVSTSVPLSIAPWLVSRVAGTGGLTFYALGSGTTSYAADSDPAFAVTEAGGVAWYTYALPTADSKALADGAGWIAHVTKQRLLYTLQFSDIEAFEAATGEAEVELFAGRGAGDFIELEAQGPQNTLPPGNTYTWAALWKLVPVPANIAVAADSAALASFAADQRAR